MEATTGRQFSTLERTSPFCAIVCVAVLVMPSLGHDNQSNLVVELKGVACYGQTLIIFMELLTWRIVMVLTNPMGRLCRYLVLQVCE